LYIDGLRRRARFVSLTVKTAEEVESDPWEERLTDPGPMPLQAAEQAERDGKVQAALESLPMDFRIPVVLCDMEGLSYEEIAVITAAPVGTVRSRIHRGRRQLRELLESFMEGSGVPDPLEAVGPLPDDFLKGMVKAS
jgi:RNA polymerase sigma factor (sigma-70 family)